MAKKNRQEFDGWSKILSLAAPLLLSLLGLQAMEIIDTMMIGSVGVNHLAASAFVNGIIGVFMVVGAGFSSAVSTLVARAQGAKHEEDYGAIVSTSLWLIVFLGVLLTLSLEVVRHRMGYFGQSQIVVDLAKDYYLYIELSLVPQLIFQVHKQFTDGLGLPFFGGMGICASLVLNAFFNWVLIYGNLGFPAMDLAGAGLATLSARVLVALGFAFALKRRREFRDLSLFVAPWKIMRRHVRPLLGIGIPAGLQYFFEYGVFAVTTFMAGWIGVLELASHQIVLKIASTSFMIPLALSMAASIQVGQQVGREHFIAAKRIGASSMRLTLLTMIFVAGILYFGRNLLPLAFVDDLDVLELAASVLVIAALFQIFDGTQAVALGILRGHLDAKVPVAITFVSYWLIACPLAYMFAFWGGGSLQGLWYGLLVGLLFSSFMLNLRLHRLHQSL